MHHTHLVVKAAFSYKHQTKQYSNGERCTILQVSEILLHGLDLNKSIKTILSQRYYCHHPDEVNILDVTPLTLPESLINNPPTP